MTGFCRAAQAPGFSRGVSRVMTASRGVSAGGPHTWVSDPKNTSRQCSACGHVAAENRDSQALFACQSCGHTAHADLNAAHNILARAITTLPTPEYAAGRAVNGRIRPTPVGRVNHPEPARQAS